MHGAGIRLCSFTVYCEFSKLLGSGEKGNVCSSAQVPCAMVRAYPTQYPQEYIASQLDSSARTVMQ